ncbi:hypothetical protein AGMMS49587_15800 [Spirochaetia bacterium]|nr:hypothetical protein AGMMS49587_15800 [Spirochaetia bacterium]
MSILPSSHRMQAPAPVAADDVYMRPPRPLKDPRYKVFIVLEGDAADRAAPGALAFNTIDAAPDVHQPVLAVE